MRSSRLIIACLLVAVFAAAAAGCSRTAKTSIGPGLTPAERPVSATGESSVNSDTTAQKAVSQTGTSNTGASTGAASGSGSGSSGSGSTTSNGATKPAQAGMSVMVIFWNDANSKKLSGAEVVVGTSSFTPSISAKSSRKNLGPLAFGKKIDLIVYPDGRTGNKIVVPMMLDRQMIPKSEQDALHVAISDTTVRVLGNAILNVDQSYPRY